MNGIIVINKSKGCTSHDIVKRAKRILNEKVGHTGTLDPNATGVLPLLVGKGTQISKYIINHDKTYEAILQLGTKTDTADGEGNILETGEVSEESLQQINIDKVFKSLIGKQNQVPPMYSAIKVNGKKLYEYARIGQEVEIKPRKVFISKIELQCFDEKCQQAKILVACSKGTYIRSIAYDLGQKMNCGGHLVELVRTKAGLFYQEKATKLEDIKTKEDVENLLVNPLDVLDLPKRILTDREKEKVSHGMSIPNNTGVNSNIVILVYGGRIYAVGIADTDKVSTKKVFEVL